MNAPAECDVATVARNLRRDSRGFWRTDATEAVSYPDDARDSLFELEQDSFWFVHRNRIILSAIHAFPPAPGSFLDAGAGNGFVTAALAQAGLPAVAIEPSPIGASNAVRRGTGAVICGSIESPQFITGAAAAAGAFDVVEHIEDDLGFLVSMKRLLRSEGMLYLTVPAFPLLWSREDAAAGHFRRYSRKTLSDVVQRAGFTVVFSTYFFVPLPLPIFLLRTLPSRFSPSRREPDTRHGQQNHLATRLALAALRFETALVRRRKSLPTGSSLLLVGRVPPS